MHHLKTLCLPTSQRHSNRCPELKPPRISGVAISLGELWNTVPRWGKKEQARESAQQAAQSTRSLLFGALSAKAVSGRSWTQSNDAQLPLTGGTPWLKRLSGCDSSWPAKCHPKANRVFFSPEGGFASFTNGKRCGGVCEI